MVVNISNTFSIYQVLSLIPKDYIQVPKDYFFTIPKDYIQVHFQSGKSCSSAVSLSLVYCTGEERIMSLFSRKNFCIWLPVLVRKHTLS